MKLREIANRIDDHLKRIEADPKLNTKNVGGHSRFFLPRASARGRFVYVTYVSYQGQSHLTKDEATRYLAALDSGSTEKHFQVLK